MMEIINGIILFSTIALGLFLLIKHFGFIQKKYIQILTEEICKPYKMKIISDIINFKNTDKKVTPEYIEETVKSKNFIDRDTIPFIMENEGYAISYQRKKEASIKYRTRQEHRSASKEYRSHYIVIHFFEISDNYVENFATSLNNSITNFYWTKFEKKLEGNISTSFQDKAFFIYISLPLYSKVLSERIMQFIRKVIQIYESNCNTKASSSTN